MTKKAEIREMQSQTKECLKPQEAERMLFPSRASITFLALRTGFTEDSFSTDQGWRDGFGMSQAHCICCALYFHYYYTSSTSDHQAPERLGTPAVDQVLPLE